MIELESDPHTGWRNFSEYDGVRVGDQVESYDAAGRRDLVGWCDGIFEIPRTWRPRAKRWDARVVRVTLRFYEPGRDEFGGPGWRVTNRDLAVIRPVHQEELDFG
jgi:hypothetical protein